MRKSMLFTAIALAIALAIAACGGSDNDGTGGTGGTAGNGTGGTGGTAGTGGTGGEGGTGGVEMTPECEAMCEHFDACKLGVTDGTGAELACPDYCGGLRQPRIVECMTHISCGEGDNPSQQFSQCQAYAPCDTMCENIFTTCQMKPFKDGEREITLDECTSRCPFQPWSDALIDCWAGIECTPEAFNACASK